MNSPALILASASPRRAELLRQIGLTFQVAPSNVLEVEGGALSVGEVAQVNAYRKARAVSKKHPDAISVGMDTVVALNNRLFGKPASFKEAEEMLLALQGKQHVVVTGVCMIHLRKHRQRIFFEQTDVTFRKLTREQIRHYHSKTNPLDKAGGYGIQDQGDVLVEAISGSLTNVIGLPLERFEAEWAVFADSAVLA